MELALADMLRGTATHGGQGWKWTTRKSCARCGARARMASSQSLHPVRALFFDVFGTLADWRSSIAREAEAILQPTGHRLDWLAIADAWRGEYQGAMEAVRTGSIPFCKLDVLHRRNLERILPRFGITGLSEEVLANLNLAWHRLD